MRKPLFASLIVLAACVLGPGSAPSRADEPTDADRAAIESLANDVFARIEAAKAARSARVDVDKAIKRAKADVGNAEKTVTVARISVAEYVEGSFPQDEQTIEGEILLAQSELARARDRLKWSDRMLKRGVASQAENLADKLDAQRCEIELANAKMKRQVLLNFTKKKQMTDLETAAKKAEGALAGCLADLVRAEAELPRAERRVVEMELTESEARVLAMLDEAVSLFEAGDSAKARERIAAATGAWREAQTARRAARWPSLRQKIRAEVEALKMSK